MKLKAQRDAFQKSMTNLVDWIWKTECRMVELEAGSKRLASTVTWLTRQNEELANRVDALEIRNIVHKDEHKDLLKAIRYGNEHR